MDGAGFLLNNEMDDFSAKPGVPNAFGLIGGDANAIEPRKRPLSSMTPTIVLKDGKPYLVTGSRAAADHHGGAAAIAEHARFRHERLEARPRPASHHQWLPDTVWVENGFPQDVLEALRARGHDVVTPLLANLRQLDRDHIKDGLAGAPDPRTRGATAAGGRDRHSGAREARARNSYPLY